MFARNSNGNPYPNPLFQQPQNNGPAFSPYAYQKNNMLNSQFQNHTININFHPNQQQFPTIGNQQPQNLPQYQSQFSQSKQKPSFQRFFTRI